MAKLSQQIAEKEINNRPSRTQRILIQQQISREEKEAQAIRDAQTKLEKATYENYEEIYNSIDPKIRSNFLSPADLKQTAGYQEYLVEKARQDEINSWAKYFSAYDKSRRGKPFVLGLNPSKSDVRKLAEVRKAVRGEPSSVPDYVLKYYESGLTSDFGTQQTVWGLDRGQTVTITKKDSATGDIKSYEVYTKDPTTNQLMYGKVTQKEIKAQQEKAYQDFVKEYPEVDLKLADQVKEETPDNRAWYDKSIEELVILPVGNKIGQGLSWIYKKAGETLDTVDTIYRWDPRIEGKYFPNLKFTSIGIQKDQNYIKEKDGKKKLDMENEIINIQTSMEKKALELHETEIGRELGVENYEAFKEQKTEQAKQEVTGLFYRSDLGREAFLEGKDEKEVQKAFEEYTKSEEYKAYEKQFNEQYQKDLDVELDKVSRLEKIKGIGITGYKVVGLNIGSKALGFVKSPTRALLTVAGGTILVGAYGLLPVTVTTAIEGSMAVTGVSRVLSSETSYLEKTEGAVLFLAGTGALSLRAIKYLRSPTVKTVKITKPKLDLKASETIGKDVKIITKQGSVNKVIYQNQKLSQTAVAGRRTIVSTKWRDLLGVRPVYQGVPYAQRGTTYAYTSLRGTSYYTTKSAYQKAMDLLTKRGRLTNYQASQTLRYIQPKIIEGYLDKGVLTVSKGKAVGEFTYLTKQPVITIDESLGIKTRGAKTISDFYRVERELIQSKSGGSFVLERSLKTSITPTTFKGFQFSESAILGKATPLKKGYLLKGESGTIKYFREIKYKDIAGITLREDIWPSSKVLKLGVQRTKLINEILDLSKDSYGYKPFISKKTPLSKTFLPTIKESTLVKEIKNTVIKQSGSGEVLKTSKDLLKSPVNLPELTTTTTPVKSVLDVEKMLETGLVNVQSPALVGALVLKQNLKQDLGLRSDIKLDVGLKNEIKTDILVKQAVKQDVGLKTLSAQKLALDVSPTLINVPAVSVRESPIPDIKPPVIPPIVIPFPLATSKGKGKKKKSKKYQDLLYLPDFTTRSLGLKPDIVTEAQAKRQLKKILTGLEIRRGVKIKY